MSRLKISVYGLFAVTIVIALIIIGSKILESLYKPVCEEVLRLNSPSQKCDAVMITLDGGATTSIVYNIYIVPKDKKINIDYKSPIFSADHFVNLKVEWINDKLLEIRYEKARIHRFKNYAVIENAKNQFFTIEIRETPLTDPPSLSRW